MNKILKFVSLIFVLWLFWPSSSAGNAALDCKCRFGVQKRIVGGAKASRNFIPWMVSLAVKDEHYCGGLIVNERFVITSARCILNRTLDEIEIRVGLFRLNDTKKIVHAASELIIEPTFLKNHKNSTEGDLGLIKLSSPIQFIENRVEPACLNLEKAIKSKSDVLMAVGFGSVEPSYRNGSKEILVGFPSNDLKFANFREDFFCLASFICVRPVKKGDSTCSHDYGGPLSRLKLHGRVDVEGVHSHLIGRADGDDKFISNECAGPAIFTRFKPFHAFLEKHIRDNYCTL